MTHRYKLTHQTNGRENDEPFEPATVLAYFLPRIGESVEHNGVTYTVLHVFHSTGQDVPTVRVKL